MDLVGKVLDSIEKKEESFQRQIDSQEGRIDSQEKELDGQNKELDSLSTHTSRMFEVMTQAIRVNQERLTNLEEKMDSEDPPLKRRKRATPTPKTTRPRTRSAKNSE